MSRRDPVYSAHKTSRQKELQAKKDQYKYRVEQVREEYLQTTGLAQALRDALKALFSEPRLPDNPYYYLCNLLGAYVDQSALWKASDSAILSSYDLEGGLEVVQPDTKLCKLLASQFAYGLPHVLRLVSKDGAEALNRVMTDGVPDTFFPSSMPFTTRDGYTIQVMSSVTGLCSTWRPGAQAFPQLEVRADVLVKGPRLEEAVRLFVDLVLTDMEEVQAIPVYVVDGLVICDPPSQQYEGAKEPYSQMYHMTDIMAKPEEFERTAIRMVLGGKCIKMGAVLFLETVASAAAAGGSPGGSTGVRVPGIGRVGGRKGGRPGQEGSPEAAAGLDTGAPEAVMSYRGMELRYEVATKVYFFHYASLEQSKIGYDQMQHYGTLPYEAMYTGVFLNLSTARQYMAMYQETDKAPYAPAVLEANTESLKRQVERGLYRGTSLEAFKLLLNVILLQDKRILGTSKLRTEDITSLEDLVLGGGWEASRSRRGRGPAGGGRGGRGGESSPAPPAARGPVGSIFSAVPNLIRILSSAAAVIQGITRELEAVSVAGSWWPDKLADIEDNARKAPTGYEYELRSDGLFSAPGTADSRRTMRTPEVSSAMVSWLRGFDMEQRLLGQLVALRQRVVAAVGKGLFSGISVLSEILLRSVPSTVPRTGSAEILAGLQTCLVQLVQLLRVGSLTVAHGFLGRCGDVQLALAALGINVVSLIDAHHGGASSGSEDERIFIPEFVLGVNFVVGSSVRSGALAERVGTEGAMLQYAVDTHLDEALAAVWMQVSQPPQPLNPFPKLLHLLRSRAAKMELWREDVGEAMSELMNELTLLRAPSFMYAAHPSAATLKARDHRAGRIGGGAGGDEEEAEAWQVYGSYAAVALADARALQTLRASLPSLLTDRHWQLGAYQGEVVPALVGDACLTSTMELDDVLGASATTLKAARPSLSPPTEHPRFGSVHFEEHHLVAGPTRKEAAKAFAAQVVNRLVHLNAHTPHIALKVDVYLLPGSPPALAAASALAALEAATHLLSSPVWSGGSSQAGAGGTAGPGSMEGPKFSGGGANTRRPRTTRSSSGHSQYVGAAGHLGTAGGQGGGGRAPHPVANVSRKPGLPVRGGGGQVLEVLTFSAYALTADAGSYKEALMEALAAATKAVPQGQPLGRVTLYGAPLKEVTYVHMSQSLIFQHAKVQPPLMPNQAMTHAARPAPASRPTTAERERLYWDRAVYERVFLSEFNAATWHAWNRGRGDPAQPFHQENLLLETARHLSQLAYQGRMLEMQKAALVAAVAVQDEQGMYELSRGCRSAAQELSALMDLNQGVVDLMGEARRVPHLSAKLDNERLRTLFLTYCSRMRRALSSPKSCYFTGLSSLAPAHLAELKEHVLSAFTLGPRQYELLEQLAVWTHACEVSVAAALHDCFDPAVRAAWLVPVNEGGARPSDSSSSSVTPTPRAGSIPAGRGSHGGEASSSTTAGAAGLLMGSTAGLAGLNVGTNTGGASRILRPGTAGASGRPPTAGIGAPPPAAGSGASSGGAASASGVGQAGHMAGAMGAWRLRDHGAEILLGED